ncbi:MAG: tRNA uridine-5-carboxymethylaminomethyl(34) synthesis GTPase MnmE [Acidobacteria bacterium RIFCSPLOWO2_12_FULL_65_11]|nr:MAG: tRNA uridine-5-carboxymethylaminomethyl(34) synthesis GTPase MnmE [Acidobacteria bacterium RIFCSPLOWO2_12_FULL_65_11]
MSFSTTDTIVAIATPPGRGGIGVVRLSGPDAGAIACAVTSHQAALEPRRATLTKVRLKPDTTAIDQAIVTYFAAPHSYTGDDVVELSAHGSPVVLQAIVSAAVASGARLAEPGEFTLRAFLNGRMDLMQAEAVADLIDAVTPLQARVAFDQLQGTLTEVIAGIDLSLFDLIARLEASVDFPEEGYHFVEPCAIADAVEQLCDRTASLLADARRGRLVREGLLLAIVGKPNVGKSSLFNALVGAARAIVTDVPGTTRDLVTEAIDLGGLRVTVVDTAGLRESADHVEAEGIARARRAQEVADLTLVLLDRSQPLDDDDRRVLSQTADSNRLIVLNKADIPPASNESDFMADAVSISATTTEGLDALRARIMTALDVDSLEERPEITNMRHIRLVERAHDALRRALEATRERDGSLSEEFVLADLEDARAALEEITGRRATDDLLAHIFSRFCVGK